ncbi:MAG: hypothetical protein KGD73_03490 [Candidatus Lokiarchaeota archaeon]|nr:hypothetical protein [Candidatus Lokiarchaeota archaeon]
MKRQTNKILILTMIILITFSSITLIQNARCSTPLIPTIGSTPVIDGVIDLQNDEWGSASKYDFNLYQNLSSPENGLPIDLWIMQDQTSFFISIQFELDQHGSSEYDEEFVGILISKDELGDYSDARLIQFSNMSTEEFQYLDYYINNSVFFLDDVSNGEGAAALDGNKIAYEFGTPIEIDDESAQDVWFQHKFTYNISIVFGKSASYPEGILIENNTLIEIQFPIYIPPPPPNPKLLINTIIFGAVGIFFIYYVISIRKIKDKVKRLRS